MTKNNAKQVRDAFARLTKAEMTEFVKEQTILFETDYRTIQGNKIGFYAYTTGKSRKIFFTDAGRTFKQLKETGESVQDSVVQALIESYGLILMSDNTIIEQQDIPLHERVSNIIQVQIGIDSMVRTWTCYKNKVKTKKVISDDNV